jgi:ATP-dependent DNA helicase PIF1
MASILNADQKAASDYIFRGGNAFLTGAAGVGKSYLLKYLICELRKKYGEEMVVVAAATGIAATQINGVTIHSWAGVQLGKGGARTLVPRVMNNKAACARWRKARVLILDEVSMIDGMLFEALDAIGREVRSCPSNPFGGIQLVLSGDFFQLPPVSLRQSGFAFETPAWTNAAIQLVELRTVVRQSGDCTFIDLLNRVRVGECTKEISDILEECHVSRKDVPTDGILPTKLYCTNRNVDAENDSKLRDVLGMATTFMSTDEFKGDYDETVRKNMATTLDKKVPSILQLKVGAQVMLTRNMPLFHLVNGSRGVVVSFDLGQKTDSHRQIGSGANLKVYPVVRFTNGVKMAVYEENVFHAERSGAMTRWQLPLKLAWSLTVHKSQGMTIERAELQLDDAFDYGQVYVALSRVVSLKGLWVCGGRVAQSAVKAHPKVVAFYQQSGSALCTNKTFVHVKEEGSSETGDVGGDGSTPKQTRKGSSPSAMVEDNQGIVDCFWEVLVCCI